ncbi:geranylgeranyltransferase beta subunit [Scheffersomyces coipomensis]|uniref:geranylgeranyltransferase beta subunit n=1 Tax=Scheffersomyces coipomensis TaxID=1788519 RepID=UPI00315DEB82
MTTTQQLYIDKHEKFFNRFLSVLPSKLQSEDSNKLAIIYFSLYGLSIIKRFKFSEVERKLFINSIYDSHLIDTEIYTAFRATSYFKSDDHKSHKYDLPNLASSLFSLQILLVLKDDFSKRINNHKIMKFLQLSQIKSGVNKGSFSPTLINTDSSITVNYGETDIRLCYIAASIRKLIKYDQLQPSQRINDIDIPLVVSFIKSRLNANGGFSSEILDESHLGYTYCALACLRLLDYDIESDIELGKVVNWLVHRQVDFPEPLYTKDEDEEYDYEYYRDVDIGSFNGRENKFGDTCYSWWCLGSLKVINHDYVNLINLQTNYKYLLNQVQNKLLGGFSKDPFSNPDPQHSFLALASLSLTNDFSEELDEIDESLVITGQSKQYWLKHINYPS